MEDLGDAPNLADLLLGGDAKEARTALIEWAATYGRLAVQTFGREHELEAQDAAKLPAFLEGLGMAPPSVLRSDLDAVAALDRDRFQVFSPGDICPDNHLLTPGGLRPIDFEGSGFQRLSRRGRGGPPGAGRRPGLAARGTARLGRLERAGELPAVAAVFRGLLALTEHWRVPDLPGYPAFRA
jgi:hypothetical protein